MNSGEGAAPGERWRPSASMDALRQRARIIGELRRFFAGRGVLEVSTPLLGCSGPRDPHLQLVQASFGAADPRRFYLQPSPESAMKRLLAAGSGPIYQIAPAMRAAEQGARHNPEFTMLEWYRPGFALSALMDEVDDLLRLCLNVGKGRRTSYRSEFLRVTGLDPFLATDRALRAAAAGLAQPDRCSRAELLDYLFSAWIEPALGAGVVHVSGFPAEQAAMAQVVDGLAQRFEVYVDGMELANAYLELTDATQQRLRFEQHGEQRRQRGQDVPPLDEHLLMALQHGLPSTCGIALGVDRLVMRALGAQRIDEVLAFPVDRA